MDRNPALTGTPTEEMRRDHDTGSGGGDPVIESSQEEGLSASSRGAGDSNPGGVDSREGKNEVKSADAVPALQTEDLLSVIVIPSQFTRVRVADHIVGKNGGPHPREGSTTVLHLRPQPPFFRIGGVSGVSVRAKNRRHVLRLPGGEVEISAKEKPRCSFECHVFYRVSVVRAL